MNTRRLRALSPELRAVLNACIDPLRVVAWTVAGTRPPAAACAVCVDLSGGSELAAEVVEGGRVRWSVRFAGGVELNQESHRAPLAALRHLEGLLWGARRGCVRAGRADLEAAIGDVICALRPSL